MKKFLTVLLAAVMLLGCAVVFVSCEKQGPKPNLDLDEVADVLDDEGYEVEYSDDEDELGVGMVEVLTAYDGDNYIHIVKYASTATAKLAHEQAMFEFDTEIEEIKLKIKLYEHYIKKYEDDLDNDEIDYYEDEIKDLEDELEDMNDEVCFGRSGKYVWYGTEDAIKDSKD